MPALFFIARFLPVLPAGSPAYTHIHRLCTSGAAPQQPAPTQPAAGGAVGIAAAASSASARTSPTPFDLGLNFATMDFEAVARATHTAIARERGVGVSALSSQRDQEFDAKLERQGEQSTVQRVNPLPVVSPVPQTAPNVGFSTSYHNNVAQTTIAAAAGGGRGFARESPVTATASRRGNGSSAHYSLHDMLKDCMMDGNWAKAYKLFTNAVNQACRQVLIPTSRGRAGSGAAFPAQTSSTSEQVDPAREAECFAALKKMLVALPPATSARRININNLRGIARWNGAHYYMLWKCLLEAGRLEEVLKVWSVMQQIGFAGYQMEEKTGNTLMALLRRTSRTLEQATTQMVSSTVRSAENFTARVEREKEIRRQLVKDLEQVATTRHFHLIGSNRRTAESIRIAEALQRVDDEGEDPGDADGATAAASVDPEESVIAVGDFNGLLRRSRAMESSQRVLRMMAKLNLEMESSTFASLIASLHNPQYVLEGHTAEELQSHVPANSPPSHHGTNESTNATAATSLSERGDAADKVEGNADTKSQYEAYKQERVETALRWFFQCPKPRRDADVYNELLYLLRAKSHWKDFDRALVELRGNAVVSPDEWPETTPERSSPAVLPGCVSAAATSAGASPSSLQPPPPTDASPVILPPRWATPPNGKTYELLIQRARYVHQWDVMWALYEEMVSGRVRGTTRLYEVLLSEAYRHPPRTLHGVMVKGSGDGESCESSEVLLRLYEELRRNGGDVHSLKGVMSVVNAWSKSRAKMNRWE
ncbi:putative mitochondrial kinetoplast polyadenylation/uridylation factor 2 [Leptomonas pyrrhocoris]|uniref:Putative mitochondrial kinetoplast polyadenylation/uridylation factor 2 n=1 Tax=Leptomonas pyrrhocoris TaxID=157538 RepID=A0A0N1J599_LEPPY|nr:putative mitochondrial kinetoplast polyadenylation/uridylation factor 2 [Leptomonas pyrrhocoris]XP_015663080.1 putative mitochondrial kinetoplast polyadenylation/uridylation factor 2 [Leptomonas pyrrhocoris]XP_015663081.1 putative mitochondrial kinetoplast polyadenylation/uridylation factor 2 [Leptomonas pyrrhocoris]KPA84640.1 putative mitochondrial kinetoplast polyadenylation/uridylation factor 2 [Leptomonas pyrrhocoris]KPA84641.1 putative mitochondrial kinetoplast polyadenylation/uridylati|eukprot:XP_015663079.1 putative mitochondrial kinetoplast polyadenylation/uridylation factor 2 [Leptomonas pyrrhocoris]